MSTIDKVRAIAQAKKQRGNIRDHYSTEGLHRVGPGLYLRVRIGVNGDLLKVWVHRYQFHGKDVPQTLGSAYEVTVEDACKAVDANLVALSQGHNPRGLRPEEDAPRTFEDEAEDFLATKYPQTTVEGKPSPEALKKASKHIKQWFKSLRDTYPVLGKLMVDQIDSEHVAEALRGDWTAAPTTAMRSLGRLRMVFARATAQKRRDRLHGNPADPETIRFSLHSNAALREEKSKHHAALYWKDMPEFQSELREEGATIPVFALRLVLFTVKRTCELLPAQWAEFDLEARVWTIPRGRVKVKRKHEHTVPLSRGAIEVLKELRALKLPGPYLFPGRDDNAHVCNDVMVYLVKAMGYGPLTEAEKAKSVTRQTLTPHGSRATFMTWVEEMLPREVDLAKAALDHKVKDKVHASYQRSDLLERRRELMDAWCDIVLPAGDSNVVSLRAA